MGAECGPHAGHGNGATQFEQRDSPWPRCEFRPESAGFSLPMLSGSAAVSAASPAVGREAALPAGRWWRGQAEACAPRPHRPLCPGSEAVPAARHRSGRAPSETRQAVGAW